MDIVFTDNSSLQPLLFSGYGHFEWLQCLYLPQFNCPLKLNSPWSFWNIRNRPSPNGTTKHPRSVHTQENGCDNWALQNGRQHLSPSSNDVVRSMPNHSWYISLYGVINISSQLRDFRLPSPYKWGHRSSVDRQLLTDVSERPIVPTFKCQAV